MANVKTDRPVAVVCGASRGLGYLLAREMLRRGHHVVMCARSADGIESAAADLRGHGPQVVPLAADVGSASEAGRVIEVAVDRFGRLDVLICNAGIIQVGPAEVLTAEDHAVAMDVMFWGLVHPALAALPELRKQNGKILAVTSVGGKIPAPHLLPYVAAKHAAVGFAEGLRVEAGADGVSVTVGIPGLMRTGSPRNALFAGDRDTEYRWFAALDSLPLVSMDAERAARKLIDATLRGRPEVILTPAAKVGARLHGIAPATTLRLLGAAGRLLPEGTASEPAPGHETAQPRWLSRLTRLNDAAARRFHQYDDETER